MAKMLLQTLSSAIILLVAFLPVNAAAEELAGTWLSNLGGIQKTIEFSKSGNFTISQHDISNLPADQKFPDRSQTGIWRQSGVGGNGSRPGNASGRQNRIYLKFTSGERDRVQGYKYRFFTLNGASALQLDGPGIDRSVGNDLGLVPQPDAKVTLAEQAGAFYLRKETMGIDTVVPAPETANDSNIADSNTGSVDQ